jgi:hypothetical protein
MSGPAQYLAQRCGQRITGELVLHSRSGKVDKRRLSRSRQRHTLVAARSIGQRRSRRRHRVQPYTVRSITRCGKASRMTLTTVAASSGRVQRTRGVKSGFPGHPVLSFVIEIEERQPRQPFLPPREYRTHGSHRNPQVEQQRPMLDVPDVVS